MESNNWVSIHTTPSRQEAELVVGRLESANLVAIAIDKKDSSYGWGYCQVMVPAGQVAQAVALLNNPSPSQE